jgi:hypothetical protein
MSIMDIRWGILGGAALALLAAPVAAQTVNYTADLSGKNQNPAVQSDGTGALTASLDSKTKVLKWELRFWGLSGPATAAHFHGPADVKSNAGVVVPIAKAGDLGPHAGQATLTDAQIADLNAGKWYVNVHTAKNAPGEIRGQVMKAK